MKVITLVHGRAEHLTNLVRGLEQSIEPATALWVVHMNQAPQDLASASFPIHVLRIDEPSGALPLARARNALAGLGVPGDWVFLDVDCIPGPALLGDYRHALAAAPQALHMGEVRYLPRGANSPGWTADSLLDQAVTHPLSRFRGAPGEPLPYNLFWSLNFACSAATFARVGGFDEGYLGYGGEDTDFAFRARAQGVELRSTQALAFHQYHDTYAPPLNHFQAIVTNARRFHGLWQAWPMEGWLQAFAELGLIAWQGSQLQVLRCPTAEEVSACLNRESGF